MQHYGAAAKPAQPRRRAAMQAPGASTQRRLARKATAAGLSAPPAPIWPANQPPHEARVSWNGRGLEIEAYNSSLIQILHRVVADTGVKLQEPSQDQRIFGSYGPGPVRDVLSKLLDGSGYNVLMIGGRDSEVPLEIVLSIPPNPQTTANPCNRCNSEDDEADAPPEPSRPPPMETPFGNGDSGTPETPQQIMQDVLGRQQKIDQQQENQQTNQQR